MNHSSLYSPILNSHTHTHIHTHTKHNVSGSWTTLWPNRCHSCHVHWGFWMQLWSGHLCYPWWVWKDFSVDVKKEGIYLGRFRWEHLCNWHHRQILQTRKCLWWSVYGYLWMSTWRLVKDYKLTFFSSILSLFSFLSSWSGLLRWWWMWDFSNMWHGQWEMWGKW